MSPGNALPASCATHCRAIPQSRFDLEHTVASGQCFRWTRGEDGWWHGVIDPSPILLRCRQEPEQIAFETSPDGSAAALADYFQLGIDLDSLTAEWAEAGPEILEALAVFPGLRVTRQDPVECLISFLCSSVAPIYRIRRTIDALCRTLGEPFTVCGAQFHAFPVLERLMKTSRAEYDAMGLGFRGGNIQATSRELLGRGGRPYLMSLRSASYIEARGALMSLPGVGAKIADCVCLFALDKQEAVPLDVHVTRIGRRLFGKSAPDGALTAKAYDALGNAYRERFGAYAGWAQQYLFYNELLRAGAWDKETSSHVPARRRRGN